MNKAQIQNKLGEIEGSLYWHNRGTFPLDADKLAETLKNKTELETAYKTAPEDLTELGNIIKQYHTPNSCDDYVHHKQLRGYEAHHYDAYSALLGNEGKLKILTYTEGDISAIYCEDKDKYNAELKSRIDWHKENS